MAIRFCCSCGSPLTENAKFCVKCGSPVRQQPAKETPATAPETEVFAAPEVAITPDPVTAEEPAVVATPIPEEFPAEEETPVVEEVPVVPIDFRTIPSQPATPVYEAPAPAPVHASAPATKKKKEKYPRRNFTSVFLAVLLCMQFFVWSALTVVFFDVQGPLTSKDAGQFFSRLLDPETIAEMPVSIDLPNAPATEKPLSDVLADVVEYYSDGNLDVDSEAIQEFLEESTLLPFISEQLGLCLTDIINDTNNFNLKPNDIRQFLEENADVIEDCFGTRMDRSTINDVVDYIDETGALDDLRASVVKEDLSPVQPGLQKIFAPTVGIILGCLAAVTFLMLLLANKWNPLYTCKDAGIVMTVLGSVLLVLTGLCRFLPTVWTDLLGSLAGSLTKAVLLQNFLSSLIIFAIGVVFILVGFLGKKLAMRIRQNKK